MDKTNVLNSLTGLEIAVIGMVGKFPGARHIQEFWGNLEKGIETIAFFSDMELEQAGIDISMIKNPKYVKAMGVLEDNDLFDAGFFDYTPVEAQLMDPQIRLFHQCAWEALEDAGYDSHNYTGPIGLFAGASDNLFWRSLSILSGAVDQLGEFETRKLTNKDFLCSRTAYKLNLKGPVFSIQTACSTSLVAIHEGCQGLLSGECDIALAGGVSVSIFKSGYLYQEGMISSPDGHCRAFDNNSKGTLEGNGIGIVVLKRLEEAVGDGDCIHAVIKGSAINNDGVQKVGFTAPSVEGQSKVIKEALRVAQVEVESIGYIETHGTGTILGDPIEIEALKLAFKTDKKGFCGIGSVKNNIGHLDTAAGVASFIKTVMALKHQLIPPNLHFQIPNQKIDFINSPFYINTRLIKWENERYPRRAGVSSLGIGGTNAHVVLEEAPQSAIGHSSLIIGENKKEKEYQLILLSAKTQTALDKMTENLANYFKDHPDVSLADAAYTLQVGRKAFKYRRMEVCSTVNETFDMLISPVKGEGSLVSLEQQDSYPHNPKFTTDKQALTGIGHLWLNGQNINWKEFYSQEQRNRLSLPTYPFEGQRYVIQEDAFKTGVDMLIKKSSIYKNSDITRWFYIPSWNRSQWHPGNFSELPGNCFWLIFEDEHGIGSGIVKALKKMNQDVVVVNKGNAFNDIGQQKYTVNPQRSIDYDHLLKKLTTAGKMPVRILHLWNLESTPHQEISIESFEEIQYTGLYSLMYLTRAMDKLKFSQEVQVNVVTTGTQNVTGQEPLSPGLATIQGAIKVIPQEFPYIICCCIDVMLPTPGSQQEQLLIEQVINEFTTRSFEPIIAYRGAYRWVQRFEPLELETPDNIPYLKKNGVYLVTGGLGRIGFVLALYLARHWQARLILVGRSPIPVGRRRDHWLDHHTEDDPISKKILKVKKLESLGNEPLVLNADAADLEQMEIAVNHAEEHFGPINGVFHAAGGTDESVACPLQSLDEAQCKKQFQGRVYALFVLEKILKNKNLDFCLLVSSLVSVLGGLGFTAYAASVTAMDTYVHYHNREHPTPWITVNTAEWLFRKKNREDTFVAAETIELYMTPDEGLETFKRILATPREHQVIVSTGNLQARIDRWIKLESLRKEVQADKKPSLSLLSRPELSTAYVPASNTVQQEMVEIWQKFFGIEPIGIEDNFFELGGDSLKAITIISKIHKALNVKISIEDFFKNPVIKYLSKRKKKSQPQDKYISIAPVEKKEYFPLSSAQKRLYVLQQLNLINTYYNIPLVLKLAMNIDFDKLEASFETLIARHDSLRTSFEIIDEEPVQRIYDFKDIEFAIQYGNPVKKEDPLQLQDAGNSLPTSYRHDQTLSLDKIIANFIKPFVLNKTPLLRVTLIKAGQEDYILMVDMHHIITDGVSHDILAEEFIALYEDQQLAALKLQYKDYSEWQNCKEQQELMKKQEEYWMNLFSGELPILNLPTDCPRSELKTWAGSSINFVFDKEKTQRLNKLAKEENTTIYMLLLTILNIFLYKTCRQEDIIIGTVVAGRQHEDLRGIMGNFVNTLALRNYPSGQYTFIEFLRQVRRQTLAAFENQTYPFEEIVARKRIPRKADRNPIFDVMFSLYNQYDRLAHSPYEKTFNKISKYHHEHNKSKFDLVLLVVESEDNLILSFGYSIELFKKKTIERFIQYYREITTSVLENENIKLKDIKISQNLLIPTSVKPEFNLQF